MLVAISIPIFSGQLEKAKASTDAANIRSGYAEVSAKVLDAPDADATYYLNADGTVSTTAVTSYECKGDSSKNAAGSFIGTQEIKSDGLKWDGKDTVSYTYNHSNSTVTVVITPVS